MISFSLPDYNSNRTVAQQILPMAGIVLLLGLFFTTMQSQAQTVRILYYSGSVSVTSGGKSGTPRLGQQLGSSDQVKIGSGGSVQLSINGKVIRYDKAATVKISDAIKRAGNGENSVVANSARTLAGASGAGRNARTSVAGATRASEEDPELAYFDSLETEALNTGSMRLNSELESATGFRNPLAAITKAADDMRGEALIILHPRSTSVPQGPVLFNWKRTPGVSAYTLSVRDYLGNEIFTAETADTFYLWTGAVLDPQTVYSWRLADRDRPGNRYGATFSILSDEENATVATGVTAIREELGADNPAAHLLLGTFYSDNACYGLAAAEYFAGAAADPEQAQTFMEMACEEYLYNMFVPVEEGYKICSGE